MAAILEDGKLRLSGYVGDYYYEDGFTSSDVVLALAQVDAKSDLEVHINSGGGVASEGAAIHALLKARSGTTNIVVEGVAASAASLIAMAGESVIMSAGAVMMIHDPSGFTFGTSDDHSKTIEGLEALATAYARVYADKSGKTAEACREIMKAERWYTPEEAVAEGFADDTTEVKAEPVAAFDYRRYAHAPKALTTLAKRKNWSLSAADNRAAASAPANRQTQEPSMSDKERADQLAAELAALKTSTSTAAMDAVKADRERRAAIMALPEAEGRTALAEHLYAKGESVDDAKATLAASPKVTASAEPDPALEHETRRLNGEGLNVNSPGAGKRGEMRVDIVASMKSRHGVKA
jgi:ATP-dependent Clp protease protease subunit